MIDLPPHTIRRIAEEQALFFLGAGYSAAYGQMATGAICARLRTEITAEANRHDQAVQDDATNRLTNIGQSDLGKLASIYDHYHGPDTAKEFICTLLTPQNLDL